MRPSLLLFVFAGLAGCGGKILVENGPGSDPNDPPRDGTPAPSAGFTPVPVPAPPPKEDPPPAGSVAPATFDTGDACRILCERDARCDTTLPALPAKEGESGDCETRCTKRLAGNCGSDDWLLCYAGHITPGACTPLPDDCRPAFCAWATCARQPVSNCR